MDPENHLLAKENNLPDHFWFLAWICLASTRSSCPQAPLPCCQLLPNAPGWDLCTRKYFWSTCGVSLVLPWTMELLFASLLGSMTQISVAMTRLRIRVWTNIYIYIYFIRRVFQFMLYITTKSADVKRILPEMRPTASSASCCFRIASEMLVGCK